MNENISNSQDSKARIYALSSLALIYLIIRFGFTAKLDSLGLYAAYTYEVICVIAAIILVGPKTSQYFKPKRSATLAIVLAFGAGFSAYKLAGVFGIQVPFDLSSNQIMILLLVVAPILEEGIFRFLLWKPIELLFQKPKLTLIATSLLFSYAHLHAVWSIPAEYHRFVMYQTAYTLVLGLGCGYYVYRYKSLVSAMMIHFGFNFGFFIALLFTQAR